MKNLIYILLLSFAFTACKSARPRVDTVKTVDQNTTTTITYVKQIDTIPIAADLVKISVPLKDLSETPISKTSKAGRATATISKVNGNIVVDCLCAEEIKIIESQNTIIETLTKRLETSDTTITEIAYRTPWYSKALSTVGIIALIVVLVTFGMKRLRPF